MITREQAVLARMTRAAVFDPEGTEVVITGLARTFDTAVVCYNNGEAGVFRLDELSASNELKALEG